MGTYYIIKAMHKVVGVAYYKDKAVRRAKEESLENPNTSYEVCKPVTKIRNGKEN
jgi:hypothetical protein